jgi:hypothetical protein
VTALKVKKEKAGPDNYPRIIGSPNLEEAVLMIRMKWAVYLGKPLMPGN